MKNEPKKLSQLFESDARWADVLHRNGVDVCRLRSSTLSVVCKDHHLDFEALEEEVARFQIGSGCEGHNSLGCITDLADHVEAVHHAYLRRTLPRLYELLYGIGVRHGSEFPGLDKLSVQFRAFHEEAILHVVKEARGVFRMGRLLDSTEPSGHVPRGLRNPIQVVTREHESLFKEIIQLEESAEGFVARGLVCPRMTLFLRGLAQVRRELRIHVKEEEEILFPAIVDREHALSHNDDQDES